MLVAILVTAIFSCSKHEVFLINHPDDVTETRFDPIHIGGNFQDRLINTDTTMVFGPQLANPYNVDVMRQALAAIREEDPDFFFPTINTSHYYVRFRPDSYEQMYDLFARDTSIIYCDFPLDRDIESGNFYHDPSIVDTLPTYQYATIKTAKWNSLINGSNVEYEILDELYIPDDAGLTIIGVNPGIGDITPIIPGDSTIWGHPTFPDNVADPASVGASVTWTAVNALEDMAYLITGNSDDDETDTNGTIASPASTTAETMSAGSNGRWTPSGCIRVYDDVKNGMIPLEGAKVIAYRGCKVKTGITDSNGNFTCDGSFKQKVNYMIKWERAYWDIRSGLTGQAYYNGPKSNSAWNLDIGNNKYAKSLGYATIHRALHRMFYGDIGGLDRLQRRKKLKVSYFNDINTPTMGVYGFSRLPSNGISEPNIRIYGAVMDVRQGELELVETPKMFFTVCHEVGHWIMYMSDEDNYWNRTVTLQESWARLTEYLAGKCEYEDLNLWLGEGCLNQARTITQEDGSSISMMIPQEYFNFQIRDTSSYYPIFVDIVDDYNQKRYYDLTGECATNIDDNISLPVSFIAPYVYSSLTIEEVGAKMLPHISLTVDAVKLQKIFQDYGYDITEN